MKRILIILLGLFSVAYGQFAPTSAKQAFKWGVSIGTRDSTAYGASDSLVAVINRQGRMMYRSTDGFWKVLANAGASDYKQVSDTFFTQGYTTRGRTKQQIDSALAVRIGGSGTTNTIPKFTAASTLGNSLLSDNGVIVTNSGNQNIVGRLFLGNTSAAENSSFEINRPMAGFTVFQSVRASPEIQSSVTSSAAAFATSISTQATSFSLNDLTHYRASQATFGAGSSVTTQSGVPTSP
jgi:DNA-binding transcriptional regulator of glucitol operon